MVPSSRRRVLLRTEKLRTPLGFLATVWHYWQILSAVEREGDGHSIPCMIVQCEREIGRLLFTKTAGGLSRKGHSSGLEVIRVTEVGSPAKAATLFGLG